MSVMPQQSAAQQDSIPANEVTETEQPAVTQEKPDMLAPKFAALARETKAIRLAKKQLEMERKAWQEERQGKDTEVQRANEWRERLKQDPYSVMLESGLTADQVAALMMNQPDPQDQQLTLVQREIQALKKAQEDAAKKQEEAQTQAYQDALTQISNDVKNLVDTNEEYETIKAWGKHQDVVDLIEATYKQDGRLMTNEEAAKEVEEYLVEEAMRLTQLKKIQAKLAPAAPLNETAMKNVNPAQEITANTLTNRMGQETAARPLTARERRERAILAFQGKLQS
ncbi:MAG: hypothetical protein IPL34_20195 [Thiofilum sp.]|uniref:hypothetical protein n=1 Tax=Thiofilum sp. TaxID=2212733 RepID=UPI0025DBE73C|nr:hypothetical protein [Thiofilum sp.]MBK8455603.1 hypothetical protein [Thiofilum sp.]